MKRLTTGSHSRKPYSELSARQQRRIRSVFRENLADANAKPDGLQSSDRRYVPDGMQVSEGCGGKHTYEPPCSSRSSSVDPLDISLDSVGPSQITLDDVSDHETDNDMSASDNDQCSECDSSFSSFCDDDNEIDTTPEPSTSNSGAPSFAEKLASCFVESGITLDAGDKILAVLREHTCFSSLPKTSKTLLGMKHQPSVLVNVEPGKYLHLGLELAIVRILESVKGIEIPSTLEIDISTDGATLGKSSRNQIWPIQCRVANISNGPTEVIGVYRGNKKPASAMDFFGPFVKEANALIEDGGVLFCERRVPIIFRTFIADAPARAFIMHHTGHTSYNPCSKCTISGTYIERRMTFASPLGTPRTDDSYRALLTSSCRRLQIVWSR